MKISMYCFIISILMISLHSTAQEKQGKAKTKTQEEEAAHSLPKLSLEFGLGTSTYFGDLKEGNRTVRKLLFIQ